MLDEKKKLVSGEVNEQDDSNDTSQVESFLTADNLENKNQSKQKNARTTSGRPKSIVQSIRNSAAYVEGNKFGEGRRVNEDGDEDNPRISHKVRASQKIEKLGTIATSASIFKAFVGLGILFLPNQFYQTGILAMPCIMVGSLILTLYCTKLLLICAEDYGDSFSEIAENAYGPKMRTLTEILIIMSQMGFCINYVYFISS